MNDNERLLIRYVCEGDIRKSQEAARLVLNCISSQKDERFKNDNLKRLANKGPELIELPQNLRDVLIAEDVSNFNMSRFLLRDSEKLIIDKVIAIRITADRLHDFGISYSPAVILHGASGTGKTMLARYMAHCLDLPFVYIRFSGLMNSYLGGTQGNLNRVFDYARTSPCVLCLDEIDAVGMRRGQKDDVGEMNRIVISLMQELDRINNNCVLVGTTNRFDRLDTALVRRFPIIAELKPFTKEDQHCIAGQIFKSVGITLSKKQLNDLLLGFPELAPVYEIVNTCIQNIADIISADGGRINE